MLWIFFAHFFQRNEHGRGMPQRIAGKTFGEVVSEKPRQRALAGAEIAKHDKKI